MGSIAILATTILLLQSVFSLYQVQYYNRFVRSLAKKYRGNKGYDLLTDVAKHLFTSAVIVVVTDPNGVIMELYFYSGLTIFSKFKRFEKFDGEKLDNELVYLMDQEKSRLKKRAFKQLVMKRMEAITL